MTIQQQLLVIIVVPTLLHFSSLAPVARRSARGLPSLVLGRHTSCANHLFLLAGVAKGILQHATKGSEHNEKCAHEPSARDGEVQGGKEPDTYMGV